MENGIADAYLFGSRVSGKTSGGSNVDIAILFDSNDMEDILVQLPKMLNLDVHPVVLNSASEALLSQILKKGRRLVVNHPKRLSEFVMTAYGRIADVIYYKNRMQQAFIRRVAGTS